MKDTVKNILIGLLSLSTLCFAYLAWHTPETRSVVSLPPKVESHSPNPSSATATIETEKEDDSPTEAEPSAPWQDTVLTRDPGRNAIRTATRQARQLPEYRALQNLVRHDWLDRRYAALFRQLNLSSSQRETLQRLLLEKQGTREDVLAASNDQGLNLRTDYAAVAALMEANLAEIDAQIQSELGADILAAYQRYEAEAPYRTLADKLSTRLGYTASPLTPAQHSQLISLLSNNQADSEPTDVPRGLGRQVGTLLNVPTTGMLDQQTMDQARGYLSPEQYQALDQIYQEQQAQDKMRAIVNRQIRKSLQPPSPER